MRSRPCTRAASKSPIYNIDQSIRVFINVHEETAWPLMTPIVPLIISFPLPRNFPRGRVIVPEPCQKEEKKERKKGRKEGRKEGRTRTSFPDKRK